MTEWPFQNRNDELTDLMSRSEFERILVHGIAAARTSLREHALLYLDLDQFKVINTISGHAAGDTLLKRLSKRLHATATEYGAVLARLGGDEFGIFVENVDRFEARRFASNVIQQVRDHCFEWAGCRHSVSASLGLVFIDQSTDGPDAVLRQADEACYMAKDSGRDRVQEYQENDRRIIGRLRVMECLGRLNDAIREGTLVLNCQRIESVAQTPSSGLLPRYEILLAMDEGCEEVFAPRDLIHAAETYGRSLAIDGWVVESTLQWMADHREDLDRFGGFSINISGHSLGDVSFQKLVLERLASLEVPGEKICFEITETAAIAQIEHARRFMQRMQTIGCSFALDDFGTGLSSYAYLHDLPVEFVKIDGRFVNHADAHGSDFAVVRSINEICHRMGKETIAEFVENDIILERIRDIGVDYAQGYAIERPKRLNQLGGAVGDSGTAPPACNQVNVEPKPIRSLEAKSMRTAR
jgi:diguanylate cyclase (GGDEF)-like protein